MYHHTCDSNFSSLLDIPLQYRVGPSESKWRKVGRPKDGISQDVLFFFEEYDEEQLTICDLGKKMWDILHYSDSVAYGNQQKLGEEC